jgi:hypothetical protein
MSHGSYITGHELIWLPPDGRVPDLEDLTIRSKKAKLTMMCGTTGSAMVMDLESGRKCNAGPYVDKVLMPLSERWREYGSGTIRRLIVHADRAPYSPDLAFSVLYLFRHVKGLLKRESFETGEDLLLAIQVVPASLEKSTLGRN